MITDEERREVAQRLRELTPWCTSDNTFMVDAIDECIFGASCLNSDFDKMLYRLADLIEPQERTCKAVGEDPLGFRLCSSCGYEAWADEDSVTPYCPMCGSKVVE